MIVPMKEVTIVAPRSDQDETLKRLLDAGVVHVAETTTPPGGPAGELRHRIDVARHAVSVLDHARDDAPRGSEEPPRPEGLTGPEAPRRHPPASEVVAEVERLAAQLDDLHATRTELAHDLERLAPFGAFDPGSVRRLRGQGVGVRLARPPVARDLPDVERAHWVALRRDRHRRAVALVGELDAVDAAEVPDEVPLPSEAPERLEERIQEVAEALERTRARLSALAAERGELQRWLERSQEALRTEQVRASMATVGAVAVLRGFVPEDEVQRVRDLAARHGWGVWVSDVGDPDEAPTLIRNPRWVRPIEPLFSFLGVVPAYGHVDVSVPFLVFFSLFFAMIVGDAGYGLVFLALTETVARRAERAPRRLISLLRLLSVGTIVWGVATGNLFGMAALPALLAWGRLDWLIVERNVIGLSFAIGAVHLTVAHVWNALRYLNSVRALAEVGWVATTWTMYFLARQLVLGDPFPQAGWIAFAVGLTLVVLFSTPWRQLRRDWFQHALLPLTLVNNFVDVVSYVRLFAVGAATFAVAAAFNDLAGDIGLSGPVGRVIGGVLSALVLFFGHTLNVLLAAMGVLVHGVRLNMLEFAGHMGVPWTGHPYRPFAHVGPSGRVTSGRATSGEGDP